MWWVRPATMTRRTERLSRLWLTTMPSDFTTFARTTLRLSGEGLRLWQSCRSPHGVGGFSFSPSDRRRVPPGRRGRCRGSGLIWAAFFAFYMYSTFSFEFSDNESKTRKCNIFFKTLLTETRKRVMLSTETRKRVIRKGFLQ